MYPIGYNGRVRVKRARAVSLGLFALFARPSDLKLISRSPQHFVRGEASFRFRFRGTKESKSAARLSPRIELMFLPMDTLDDDTLSCCSCAGRAWASYYNELESSGDRHLPLTAQRYPYGRFLTMPFTK